MYPAIGPTTVYEMGCSEAQDENLAPCFGLQFFGHVAIEGATEVMTVSLKDVGGRVLWSTSIAQGLADGPAKRAREIFESGCAEEGILFLPQCQCANYARRRVIE